MVKEKWDTEWLIFYRKTRRGAIVLLILFFCIAISPRVYQLLFVSNDVTTVAFQSIAEASFLEEDEKQVLKESEDKTTVKSTREFPKDKSDPNKFSKSEWMNMGLSEKQVETVLNYKKSIGGFKSFDDLEKVYVFNAEILTGLRNNISFTEKSNKSSNLLNDTLGKAEDELRVPEVTREVELEQESNAVFEINTATKEELMSINGIGSFFANEIIEQRHATGGFVELKQLLSIYNFDKEKLKKVRPYLTVDSSKVRKLNLNLVTLDQLKNHPDITWSIAKSIIDLRTQLGAFTSLDQLLLSVHIDSEKYRELLPYFDAD